MGVFCISVVVVVVFMVFIIFQDFLNWVCVVRVMVGSYFDEVKSFVKMFYEVKEVFLEGVSFIVVYVVVVVC